MIKEFFTSSYQFSTSSPDDKQFYILLGSFLLLIIFSIMISISKKLHKGLKSRLFNLFMTVGVVGIILSFFRYQSIPYVGVRFLITFLIAVGVVWYFIIVGYILIRMPKEVRAIENNNRYKRYLPKKKNK